MERRMKRGETGRREGGRGKRRGEGEGGKGGGGLCAPEERACVCAAAARLFPSQNCPLLPGYVHARITCTCMIQTYCSTLPPEQRQSSMCRGQGQAAASAARRLLLLLAILRLLRPLCVCCRCR